MATLDFYTSTNMNAQIDFGYMFYLNNHYYQSSTLYEYGEYDGSETARITGDGFEYTHSYGTLYSGAIYSAEFFDQDGYLTRGYYDLNVSVGDMIDTTFTDTTSDDTAFFRSMFSDSDTVYGSDYDDTLYGYSGDDNIYGFNGNDKIHGGNGNDYMIGSYGNDSLFGGSGTDYMVGGDGHDSLSGGNDTDAIKGKTGNDALNGGLGNDWLKGGAGYDSFTFNTKISSTLNVDTIADFNPK